MVAHTSHGQGAAARTIRQAPLLAQLIEQPAESGLYREVKALLEIHDGKPLFQPQTKQQRLQHLLLPGQNLPSVFRPPVLGQALQVDFQIGNIP